MNSVAFTRALAILSGAFLEAGDDGNDTEAEDQHGLGQPLDRPQE